MDGWNSRISVAKIQESRAAETPGEASTALKEEQLKHHEKRAKHYKKEQLKNHEKGAKHYKKEQLKNHEKRAKHYKKEQLKHHEM